MVKYFNIFDIIITVAPTRKRLAVNRSFDLERQNLVYLTRLNTVLNRFLCERSFCNAQFREVCSLYENMNVTSYSTWMHW